MWVWKNGLNLRDAETQRRFRKAFFASRRLRLTYREIRKSIANKYRQSIDDAFATILDKGDEQHKRVMNAIIDSDMLFRSDRSNSEMHRDRHSLPIRS